MLRTHPWKNTLNFCSGGDASGGIRDVSALYSSTGRTKDTEMFPLFLREIFSVLKKNLMLPKILDAQAILLSMSSSSVPSLLMTLPRYLNDSVEILYNQLSYGDNSSSS